MLIKESYKLTGWQTHEKKAIKKEVVADPTLLCLLNNSMHKKLWYQLIFSRDIADKKPCNLTAWEVQQATFNHQW